MTIDEAIKVLNKYNYEEVTMYEPEWDAINTLVRLAEWYKEHDIKNKYEAQTDIIAQMERELNWYRSHDIIERERARLMCQFFYDEELRNLLTESIASLPKAKPPKE